MSVESEAIKFLLRAGNVKWDFSSELAMRHFVKCRRSVLERNPRDYLRQNFQIDLQHVEGFPVYQVRPAGEEPKRRLLFLHGGAFVSVIKGLHWGFIRRLMLAIPCQVTVPLYGLVPRYDHRDAYRLLRTVYRNILDHHIADDVVFMGDSCGAGLSLGFAQSLPDLKLPQPGGIVLLSPWLDLTLQNPSIAEVEADDPVLAVPGNQEAGRMWAAGTDLRSPMLSPLYGELAGLPPILQLIGSCDLLVPDARLLRDKAQIQQHSFLHREYPGMFHNWMLSTIPEGRQALDEIIDFICDLNRAAH